MQIHQLKITKALCSSFLYLSGGFSLNSRPAPPTQQMLDKFISVTNMWNTFSVGLEEAVRQTTIPEARPESKESTSLTRVWHESNKSKICKKEDLLEQQIIEAVWLVYTCIQESKVPVASKLFNRGFPLGEVDVALQIRLQSSLLQDLNDVMDARLKVSQFPWDSRQVKDIWIEMDNSEKTSRVFCCDFCRPSGFTSASWGCSRQHCTDKTPGSYPQALLGEGCGYVQAEFPVNKFSNMLQLWLWAIFQSSLLLFPPFQALMGTWKIL